MGSEMIETVRSKSEICQGEMECQKRSIELLDEFGIPRGLFPLRAILEVGLNRSDGFLWLKLKDREDHYFEQIGKIISFAIEITGYISPRRLRKLKGVKSKELFFWIPVSEMVTDESRSGSILFKAIGLSNKLPVSAFIREDEPDNKYS